MLPDAGTAAMEAARSAAEVLGDRSPTLSVVFASVHHLARAERILEAVHDAVRPAALIGCVAEGVLAGRREVEAEPAVSVWLASMPEPVETFHMQFVRTESGGVLAGWRFEPDGEGPGPVHLLLADPFTVPADLLLRHLNEEAPGAVVVGGMAGGAGEPGRTALFRDMRVHHEGAVGVRLPASVGVRTIVSQGCRPIGRSFVVTRADRNVLQEVGGRPPLERLRDTVAELAPADRELVSRGLHVGKVIDEYKAEHGVGDFLIRGVVGADPQTGAVAVGDLIEVGETVQFHVRDAAAADEELRSLLELHRGSLEGPPVGALLFTCNGRGTRLFTQPDHDANVVSSSLGGVPVAGFFCAGEIGPVGGRNFVHGFTASVAVFFDRAGA